MSLTLGYVMATEDFQAIELDNLPVYQTAVSKDSVIFEIAYPDGDGAVLEIPFNTEIFPVQGKEGYYAFDDADGDLHTILVGTVEIVPVTYGELIKRFHSA